MNDEIFCMQVQASMFYDLVGVYQELLAANGRGVSNEQLLAAIRNLNVPEVA